MNVVALPADVKPISWVAEQLGISLTTAYRLAERGNFPVRSRLAFNGASVFPGSNAKFMANQNRAVFSSTRSESDRASIRVCWERTLTPMSGSTAVQTRHVSYET